MDQPDLPAMWHERHHRQYGPVAPTLDQLEKSYDLLIKMHPCRSGLVMARFKTEFDHEVFEYRLLVFVLVDTHGTCNGDYDEFEKVTYCFRIDLECNVTESNHLGWY